MQRLGELISTHKLYYIGFSLLLVITLIPQLVINQNELFLIINGLNNSSLDFIFYWLTYLGDGLVFIVLIFILLFISYSKALLGMMAFLVTSLIAQILKQVFFAQHYRPFKVLAGQYSLHVPDGVQTLANNSFPSGHAVTVFALATFLILAFSIRKMVVAVLLLAWLIVYSRIYLTHHYPIDVWVGSIIGVVGTLLIFWLLAPYFQNKFGNKSLLNR